MVKITERFTAQYANYDQYKDRVEKIIPIIEQDTDENLLVLFTSHTTRANDIFNSECFSVGWEYNTVVAEVIKMEILARMKR